MADRTLAQIATTSTAASLLAGDRFYMLRSGVDFSLPGSVIISAIASAVSTSAATKEASLGNPAVTGYILSSTSSGVRSWIALPASDWGSITGIPAAVSTFGAAGILSGALGGTGVANTGKTLTIGGNWTHSGAHTVSLTTTASTALTLPTTGTLATLVGVETLSNKAIESSEIGGVDPAPGSFTELYSDIADLRAITVNGGTVNTHGAQFLLPSITDTTSRPFLITQTWDNAALDAIGVLVNITSADSGAGSLLQAWQLDGGTVASVDTSGRFLGSGSGLTALNASSITSGTVPTARLGTGTANSTTYLRGDQTWQTVSGGGGDALVANPLSQFAATTSLQLAGVISDETGSGALVFATSPTLVTPALGTPASGALTNCTSIPAAQLTGDIAAASITTALTTAQPIAATTLSATGNVSVSGANPTAGNTQSGRLESHYYTGIGTNNIVLGADTTGAPNIRLQVDNTSAHIGLNIGGTPYSAFTVERDGGTGEPWWQLRSADFQADGVGANTKFYQNGDTLEWHDVTGRRARMLTAGAGGLVLDAPNAASYGVFSAIISGDASARISLGLDSGNPFLGFGPGSGARDTFVYRDAANTLAQRNGTAAQALRVYGTTDAGTTNYERLEMAYVAANTRYEIGPSAGGTGSLRTLQVHGGASGGSILLNANGTTIGLAGVANWWRFDSAAGHLLALTDNAYDIGASGARPRNIYAAGQLWTGAGASMVLLSTGGGTNAAGFSSPADGVMRVGNYAGDGFNRIQLGGTTSSFPALKRRTTAIEARLADDSAITTLVGAMVLKAGAVSDADFTNPVDGCHGYDTTNFKHYVRSGGTWRSSAAYA